MSWIYEPAFGRLFLLLLPLLLFNARSRKKANSLNNNNKKQMPVPFIPSFITHRPCINHGTLLSSSEFNLDVFLFKRKPNKQTLTADGWRRERQWLSSLGRKKSSTSCKGKNKKASTAHMSVACPHSDTAFVRRFRNSTSAALSPFLLQPGGRRKVMM